MVGIKHDSHQGLDIEIKYGSYWIKNFNILTIEFHILTINFIFIYIILYIHTLFRIYIF